MLMYTYAFTHIYARAHREREGERRSEREMKHKKTNKTINLCFVFFLWSLYPYCIVVLYFLPIVKVMERS